jgi:hypothetical protein
MLEHPSIRRYELSNEGRDNPTGADNQQETQEWGSSETARKAPLLAVKVQSDPYGDIGSQAEMTWPSTQEVGSNKSA